MEKVDPLGVVGANVGCRINAAFLDIRQT